MKYGVEIIISIILIILILFVVGYIMRKKYYREVDRLDVKKMELMSRPIAEELGKIKKLNMMGQTEEMFEGWRKSWDDIMAVQFPYIDELLFYAEEQTDKYRFKQAKETHEKVEEILLQIDQEMDRILRELNDLLSSEEKNRTEYEGVLAQYQDLRRTLLAHQHLYGVATKRLESILESIAVRIQEYEELTSQGDYLDARNVVTTLVTDLEDFGQKMEKIPDLLTECSTIIPTQKSELQDGYREMKQDGFVLEHLQIDQFLDEIDTKLKVFLDLIKDVAVAEVEEGIIEIKEKIEQIYDNLEKEVYAQHFVFQEKEKIGYMLEQLKEMNDDIQSETNFVQNSYHLLDKELEIPKKLEKELNHLIKRHELLLAKIGDEITPFSILSEEMKGINEDLQRIQNEQSQYSEMLQNLRKDEMEAKEKVGELRRKVREIIRQVKQSHLPGLPSDFESLYEQAEEQIADVNRSLQEKPLNMKVVQSILKEAMDTIEHLYEKTTENIETAQLAERVIQYGNRYRATHAELASELEKAEQAFRSYEYMASLEQAATAVEKVEPGALKRIEDIYKDKS